MDGLQSLCIKSMVGDQEAIKSILANKFVQATVTNAAVRLQALNPEYDLNTLRHRLESIIWERIEESYSPSTMAEKTDHLVVRFIKKSAFNALLTEIKKEKGLISTLDGFRQFQLGIEKVSAELAEAEPDDVDKKIDRTLVAKLIHRATVELLNREKKRDGSGITELDVFILMSRFKLNSTLKDISKQIGNKYGITVSPIWIHQRLNKTILPKMKLELNRLGLREEDGT